MNFNLSMNLKSANVSKSTGLKTEVLYDLIVIGGGPAGLNAALYAKRKGLQVGVIAKSLGGQVKDTSSVENYLGTLSLSGETLVENFVDHLKSLEVPVSEGQMVVGYEFLEGIEIHQLTLEYGEVYQSKTVLLAMGSTPRKLGVAGEKEFLGKGVAYCAICDGPLFKGKEVIIAGGGNAAVEAALDLGKIASKVKLIHRSQLRADQILIDELEQKENIEVLLETKIEAILGSERVSGVKIHEGRIVEADGVFVEIGYVPNVGVFKNSVTLNAKGEIDIDSKNKTNISGVFAAGDVTNVPYKQIVIAAAEGAKAALSINEYLQTHSFGIEIRNISL